MDLAEILIPTGKTFVRDNRCCCTAADRYLFGLGYLTIHAVKIHSIRSSVGTIADDDIFICLDNPIQDDCRTRCIAIPNEILALPFVRHSIANKHFFNVVRRGNSDGIVGIEARNKTGFP